MSPLRRAWARIPGNIAQWVIVVWVVGISVGVGWVIADRLQEDSRRVAAARVATIAFCTKTRGEALAPLTDASSEFARNDVRGAIFAFNLAQCDQYVGRLPMDEIAPQAFLPAPAPTATRRP